MKKIMFNDRYGLTHAVLQGKKTMTRRLLPVVYDDMFIASDGVAHFRAGCNGYIVPQRNQPTYHVGEEVAIAQQYNVCFDLTVPRNRVLISTLNLRNTKGWNNKMFVKADLMPHRIIIRNVCAQRLQSISDDDCLNEGVLKIMNGYFVVPGLNEKDGVFTAIFETPREAFAALIDRISGKGTWERNPWAYVYQFEC